MFGGHLQLLQERLAPEEFDAFLQSDGFLAAVDGGQLELLRTFASKIDPNKVELASCVSIAVQGGSLEVFRFLLSLGFRHTVLDTVADLFMSRVRLPSVTSPLIQQATVETQVAIIEEALKFHPGFQWTFDIVDRAIYAHLPVSTVRYLLSRLNAHNPSVLPSTRPEALYLAAANGDLQMVRFLLSVGFSAEPNVLLMRSFELHMDNCRVPDWLMRAHRLSLSPETCRQLIIRSTPSIAWLLKRGVDLDALDMYRFLLTDDFGLQETHRTITAVRFSIPSVSYQLISFSSFMPG